MRYRLMTLAAILAIVSFLLPQNAQAAFNSGQLAGVSWETEVQLVSTNNGNTYGNGRTTGTGDMLSGLSRVKVKVKHENAVGTKIGECSDEGVWNLLTSVAEASCGTSPWLSNGVGQQNTVVSEHEFKQRGNWLNLPDMDIIATP